MPRPTPGRAPPPRWRTPRAGWAHEFHHLLLALDRVRATGSDFTRFIHQQHGEYQAVSLLLALNLGHPRIGGRMLRLLAAPHGVTTWAQFLMKVNPTVQPTEAWARNWLRSDEEASEFHQLATRLQFLAQQVPLLEPLEPYRRWAPEVGRYAFDWNLS